MVSMFSLPLGGLGELSLVVWLLIMGVKEQPVETSP